MFAFSMYALGVLTGIVIYAVVDAFFDIQSFLEPKDPYSDEEFEVDLRRGGWL